MSQWLVARAIPAELLSSLGALKFVKEEIILPFGSPKFILSGDDLKFDCKTIKTLLETKRFNGRILLLINLEVMVWLNTWRALSRYNCRRCVERIWQTVTYACTKFYTGIASVQVLTVNPFRSSVRCQVSIFGRKRSFYSTKY